METVHARQGTVAKPLNAKAQAKPQHPSPNSPLQLLIFTMLALLTGLMCHYLSHRSMAREIVPLLDVIRTLGKLALLISLLSLMGRLLPVEAPVMCSTPMNTAVEERTEAPEFVSLRRIPGSLRKLVLLHIVMPMMIVPVLSLVPEQIMLSPSAQPGWCFRLVICLISRLVRVIFA